MVGLSNNIHLKKLLILFEETDALKEGESLSDDKEYDFNVLCNNDYKNNGK